MAVAEEQDSYLARLKAQLASLRSENEQLAARMGFDSASSPVVAATAAELSATALRDQPPSVRRARRRQREDLVFDEIAAEREDLARDQAIMESLYSSTYARSGTSAAGNSRASDADVAPQGPPSRRRVRSRRSSLPGGRASTDSSASSRSPGGGQPRRPASERKRRRSQRTSRNPLDSWEPKITVPKPFAFNHRPQRKTRSQIRLEREMEERRVADEIARRTPFRATPVPATSILPLFDGIINAQEQRRRTVHEKSKEITEARSKPFSFYQRDKDKWYQRHHTPEPEPERFPPFKASPMPEDLREEVVLQRMAAEDAARKERVQERAHELLKKASLPPRMQRHDDEYKEKLRRLKAEEEEIQAHAARKGGSRRTPGSGRKRRKNTKRGHGDWDRDLTFKPKINRHIPDFKRLQADFEAQLEHKRRQFKTTTPKEYEFAKSGREAAIAKVREDIKRDEVELIEYRWPYKTKRAPVKATPPPKSSMEVRGTGDHPAKGELFSPAPTRTSMLKARAAQIKLAELELLERQEIADQLERELKRKELARRLQPKLRDSKDRLAAETELKRVEFEEEMRRNEEAHKEFLQRTEEKLNRRPFLFEQVAIQTAAQKARAAMENAYSRAGHDGYLTYDADPHDLKVDVYLGEANETDEPSMVASATVAAANGDDDDSLESIGSPLGSEDGSGSGSGGSESPSSRRSATPSGSASGSED